MLSVLNTHTHTSNRKSTVFSALRIRGWHSGQPQLLENEWVRRESFKVESQRDHLILHINSSQISDWPPYHACLRQAEKCSKNNTRGFPGGAVVGNLPANAGGTGSSPGLGGSHVPQSGWAREPQLLSLRVWSLCSATREAAMVRGPRTAMRSGPHLPQLERALARKRGPNIAINQSINK